MITHTNTKILYGGTGEPEYVLIPFCEYEALVKNIMPLVTRPPKETGIPSKVVTISVKNGVSLARAWREYLGLTQTEVAKRMGITQGSYAQIEAAARNRRSTREKLASALEINVDQLD